MARCTSNYISLSDGRLSARAHHYCDAVEKWWSVNGFDDSELKPLKEDSWRVDGVVRRARQGPGRRRGGAAGQVCGPRGDELAAVFVEFTPTGTPAPSAHDTFGYVRRVSDGSTVRLFKTPRGGMNAHYLDRRVNRTGATGPWIQTSSATIAA